MRSGRLQCVFLGAGPGGTGPLIAALQRGRLQALLRAGVAIVERGPRIGSGRLGRYALRSDSATGSFLECLEPPPARAELGALLERPHVRALQELRSTHAPLPLVARLLDDVGAELERLVRASDESAFLAGHEALSLEALSGGAWRVELRDPDGDARTLETRSVVLALGGEQSLEEALAREVAPGVTLARFGERVVLTDELFSPEGRERLRAALAGAGREARVVVLGGSHSAFSSAWTALDVAPEGALGPRAVTIAFRGRPKVFYPSPDDARREGYADFGPDDVCPLTGRVHRLGGLRADGRELARRALGLGGAPREERLELVPLAAFGREPRGLVARLEAAACIVPAFGYRARTLPARDADGRALALGLPDRRRLVDDEGRVLDAAGRAVPGLFGIGLASGYVPKGEPSFRGHTNGVWLYQNDTGARILAGIAP